MKISKLFHWLYGLVMLLPIFAIGVTCLYATFNDNAYKSYENINNDTENFESVFSEDLVSGEIYYFNSPYFSATTTTQSTRIYEYNFTDFEIIQTSYATSISSDVNSIRLRYGLSGSDYIPFISFGINGTYGNNLRLTDYTFFFKFRFLNSNSNAQNYSSIPLNSCFVQILYESDVNYISNSFYYAVNKVQQSPLFNWAYNSFLVTPFVYIVSLFSMPTNSFVVMLLSYWLAISIIWLVFDLIMYVPLLVHRWLDKGVLE